MPWSVLAGDRCCPAPRTEAPPDVTGITTPAACPLPSASRETILARRFSLGVPMISRTTLATGAVIGALAVAATAGPAAGQAAPGSPAIPAVGQLAPDFSLTGATRYGLLASPVRLSDFRGKTVVLAFFFQARTKG